MIVSIEKIVDDFRKEIKSLPENKKRIFIDGILISLESVNIHGINKKFIDNLISDIKNNLNTSI